MNIYKIFDHPLAYQWYQQAGGFFGARIKAIDQYLAIQSGSRILDIGCGPGFIVKHLPKDARYVGFDTDERYIDYARNHFGNRGEFVLGYFDDNAAVQYGPADVVMMNGVLHHLTTDEARATLRTISKSLRPGGLLFTLDGCYVDGQSSLARYLLEKDRGLYVRNKMGYTNLLQDLLPPPEVHIRSDLSRVPYTFIIMVVRKPD